MKIYVMTDSHLGHTTILQHGVRKKGYEVEIFASLLDIKGDLLIHLGDFCIGDDAKWHYAFLDIAKERFNKVVLVLGNHDNHSDSWFYDKGWDFVCRSFSGKYFGKKIIFSHIPIQKTELFDFNIHGHLHGMSHDSHRIEDVVGRYNPKFHIDVAPEVRGYAPVNLEKLI